MNTVLAKNYAQALFQIAVEQDNYHQYQKELSEICECIQNNTELKNILNHPIVNKVDKKQILNKVFVGEKMINNFLMLLIDKGRLNYLSQINYEFINLCHEKDGIEVAYVTSAQVLSESKILEIKKVLEKRYQKKILIKSKVDASLLAGIRVKVKDEIIDNSIERKLDDLYAKLLKSSL